MSTQLINRLLAFLIRWWQQFVSINKLIIDQHLILTLARLQLSLRQRRHHQQLWSRLTFPLHRRRLLPFLPTPFHFIVVFCIHDIFPFHHHFTVIFLSSHLTKYTVKRILLAVECLPNYFALWWNTIAVLGPNPVLLVVQMMVFLLLLVIILVFEPWKFLRSLFFNLSLRGW